MAIGIFQAPDWNDTNNITNPLGEAINSGLKTYGDVNALRQSNQQIEANKYANMVAKAKSQYAPQMALAELQEAQAKPAYTIAQTAYQNAMAKGVPSEIALRYAQTEVSRTEAQKQKLLNRFVQKREAAEIDKLKADANYYRNGGPGASTGSRDQTMYMDMVSLDNPQLKNPEQIREAANVLANGGTQLADGTSLTPMSPLTRMTYDRAFKATTTSPLITQGVSANAAEAELGPIDKAIANGRKPYGDTINGYSPTQLSDSFNSSNPKSAKRLGQYIAADQLAFEKAALQTRIAGTESGVTIINEIMDKSRQQINAKYPKLSDEARQVALDTISDTLKEALKERNKYGIGASSAAGKNYENNERSSKNIKVPEFRSKEEFQQWFKSQPKISQDAIRMHLRNQ